MTGRRGRKSIGLKKATGAAGKTNNPAEDDPKQPKIVLKSSVKVEMEPETSEKVISLASKRIPKKTQVKEEVIQEQEEPEAEEEIAEDLEEEMEVAKDEPTSASKNGREINRSKFLRTLEISNMSLDVFQMPELIELTRMAEHYTFEGRFDDASGLLRIRFVLPDDVRFAIETLKLLDVSSPLIVSKAKQGGSKDWEREEIPIGSFCGCHESEKVEKIYHQEKPDYNQDHLLFIGSIPHLDDLDFQSMKDLFPNCSGRHIVLDDDGTSRGYMFLEFSSARDADKLFEQSKDGIEFGDGKLTVLKVRRGSEVSYRLIQAERELEFAKHIGNKAKEEEMREIVRRLKEQDFQNKRTGLGRKQAPVMGMGVNRRPARDARDRRGFRPREGISAVEAARRPVLAHQRGAGGSGVGRTGISAAGGGGGGAMMQQMRGGRGGVGGSGSMSAAEVQQLLLKQEARMFELQKQQQAQQQRQQTELLMNVQRMMSRQQQQQQSQVAPMLGESRKRDLDTDIYSRLDSPTDYNTSSRSAEPVSKVTRLDVTGGSSRGDLARGLLGSYQGDLGRRGGGDDGGRSGDDRRPVLGLGGSYRSDLGRRGGGGRDDRVGDIPSLLSSFGGSLSRR